jgi:1-acyl-sn-glycerol-3-phosphate acyltransferase
LAHFIPVNRRVPGAAILSMEKAIKALGKGQSFLIYPEGTRSPDGRLQEFKKGAAVMAIKAKVPVVPVACSGAQHVMQKRSLVVHPGEILVQFLDPIDASAYSFEQRDAFNNRLYDAMATGLPSDQKPLGFPGAQAEDSAGHQDTA